MSGSEGYHGISKRLGKIWAGKLIAEEGATWHTLCSKNTTHANYLKREKIT